jgi:hypothetical protein
VAVSPTFRRKWGDVSAAVLYEQCTETFRGCIVGHFDRCGGEPDRIVPFPNFYECAVDRDAPMLDQVTLGFTVGVRVADSVGLRIKRSGMVT